MVMALMVVVVVVMVEGRAGDKQPFITKHGRLSSSLGSRVPCHFSVMSHGINLYGEAGG